MKGVTFNDRFRYFMYLDVSWLLILERTFGSYQGRPWLSLLMLAKEDLKIGISLQKLALAPITPIETP